MIPGHHHETGRRGKRAKRRVIFDGVLWNYLDWLYFRVPRPSRCWKRHRRQQWKHKKEER